MADDDLFQPTEIEVSVRDDGQFVKVAFSDDNGETRPVALTKPQSASLVMQLIRKLGSEVLVPIDRESMKVGQGYRLVGHGVRRKDDEVLVDLFLELLPEGRGVQLRLPLSLEDARVLRAELDHGLKDPGT